MCFTTITHGVESNNIHNSQDTNFQLICSLGCQVVINTKIKSHCESASGKDKRALVIKLKKNDPTARFRIESGLGPLESLRTERKAEQGLEMPESYFVELGEYEKEHGSANPEDIVHEIIDDKQVTGVFWLYLIIIEFFESMFFFRL